MIAHDPDANITMTTAAAEDEWYRAGRAAFAGIRVLRETTAGMTQSPLKYVRVRRGSDPVFFVRVRRQHPLADTNTAPEHSNMPVLETLH